MEPAPCVLGRRSNHWPGSAIVLRGELPGLQSEPRYYSLPSWASTVPDDINVNLPGNSFPRLLVQSVQSLYSKIDGGLSMKSQRGRAELKNGLWSQRTRHVPAFHSSTRDSGLVPLSLLRFPSVTRDTNYAYLPAPMGMK